jgi:hypothetical protein
MKTGLTVTSESAAIEKLAINMNTFATASPSGAGNLIRPGVPAWRSTASSTRISPTT